MSTNCLVTKLKGVVNNDNLEKLGIIELTNVHATPFMLMLPAGGTIKAEGGTFSFRNETGITEYVSPDDMISEGSVNPSSDNMIFKIGKYKINRLISANSTQTIFNAFNVDLKELTYIDNTIILKGINNCKNILSLSSFKDLRVFRLSTEDTTKHMDGGITITENIELPNMLFLMLSDMNTEINVEKIINAAKLGELEIINCPNATGNLKAMALKTWQHGRNSGYITIRLYRNDSSNTNIHWDGQSVYDVTGSYTPKIKFTVEGFTLEA